MPSCRAIPRPPLAKPSTSSSTGCSSITPIWWAPGDVPYDILHFPVDRPETPGVWSARQASEVERTGRQPGESGCQRTLEIRESDCARSLRWIATRPLCLGNRLQPVSPAKRRPSPRGTAGILLSPTTGVLTRARVAVHRRERAPSDSMLLRLPDSRVGGSTLPELLSFSLFTVQRPHRTFPVASRWVRHFGRPGGYAPDRADQGGLVARPTRCWIRPQAVPSRRAFAFLGAVGTTTPPLFFA